MLQQKKELGSFLDCAFGRRTISLCKDGLRFRGDWYSSCTFSRTDYEHYLKLFELILMSKEERIEVIDYNDKGEIYIKCKSVLEGLNRYFARFGVVYSVEDSEKKDTESTNKKSKAEQICCNWMYHALKNHILEALLISNLDGKLIDKEKELIDEQLIKAMKAVSPSPFGQVPVSSNMTRRRTIQLCSWNHRESECNYFTSIAGSNIARSHITNYYKRITSSIECPILCGEESSVCEEVLLEYFSRFSKKEDVYINPDMPCDTEQEIVDDYRFARIDLTEYKASDALVESVKCTYGTVIDPNCLLDFKGETAFDVALAIAEEGEKEFFYRYLLQKGSEYYCYCNDVFQMINDQLKRIFSVNLELLISGKKNLKGEETTIEATDCDIELEKAIVNYNHVESLFMLKGLTKAQYIEQTYLIIQSIIINYAYKKPKSHWSFYE